MPSRDEEMSELIRQSNETAAFWVTSMLTAVAVLAELIRQHGGCGPWLDELRATMIARIKNEAFEGIALEREAEVTARAVRLVEGIFESARAEYDRD